MVVKRTVIRLYSQINDTTIDVPNYTFNFYTNIRTHTSQHRTYYTDNRTVNCP